MWLLSCEWDITDRTFILCDRSIQDDATPIHSLCHVLGNIAKYRIPQACHLPCNLNWAPCDFWLFSKLEFQFFRNSVLSVTWKSLRYRRFGLSFCYLFRIGNLSRNVFWVTSPWTAYFFFLIIGHSGWSLLFTDLLFPNYHLIQAKDGKMNNLWKSFACSGKSGLNSPNDQYLDKYTTCIHETTDSSVHSLER